MKCNQERKKESKKERYHVIINICNSMGGFCILVRINDITCEYEILLQRRSGQLKNPYQWCLPGGSLDRQEGEILKNIVRNDDNNDEVQESLRCTVARRVALRECIEETGGGEGCPVNTNFSIRAIPEGSLNAVSFSYDKIVIPPILSRDFLDKPNLSRELRTTGKGGKFSSTSYFVYVLQGEVKRLVTLIFYNLL